MTDPRGVQGSGEHPGSGGRAIGLGSPGESSVPPLSAGTLSAEGTGAEPRAAREQFDAGELAMVCSHFDVGVIEAVREYRRGSSRAPKVALKTSGGMYLLKRRAAGSGKDSANRVALSHAVQAHLAQRRFPLPRLVRTRENASTSLELNGRVYELFEFVPGNGYDGSLDATGDAGRLLAFFHKLLGSFETRSYTPPVNTFHRARGVEEHLTRVGENLLQRAGSTAPAADRLRITYTDAARRVDRIGIGAWPLTVLHGDWHPGNMVFRGSRVVAVIDYDSVRVAPRIIDIANGVMQFSIVRAGDDPERWPPHLDEGRFKRFCRGYETVKDCVISSAELEALPWLMIEALIVEALIPIAATGSFAGHSAASFLRMVDVKTAWLAQHAARLTALVGD